MDKRGEKEMAKIEQIVKNAISACSNSELLCNFELKDYNICGGGIIHGNKEYYIRAKK